MFMRYSEKTIYKKARAIGYSVHKGKLHFMSSSYPVYSDEVGYNVVDDSTGITVWGCYNNIFDHLWNIEDVEDFLKKEYDSLGLVF